MALIDQNSQQIPLPEFDLFASPQTQVAVREDIVTEHRAISTVQASHPLEFLISTAADEYVNFRETILYLRLHFNISKNDGTPVTAADWDNVIPANNLLHSIFESVECIIGDTQVNVSSSTYPYRAIFDALFNTGDAALKTYMSGSLFDMNDDTRKTHLKPKVVAGTKSIGNTLDLGGKLHLDLTFQDRAIIGGCEIRIKLIPHKPSFYLQLKDAKLAAEVVFEDASLEVHRSKVYEPIAIAHAEALKITPAKYPINRFEVKQFTVNSGALDAYVDNAIAGQLPRRIYVALVANDAFHGTATTDPFKFDHFNVDYMVCFYNANQYPAKPYKPNFDKNQFTREYLGLFGTSNQIFANPKCIITRDKYKDGYTFFGFNFAPDLADDCNTAGHVSIIKRGTLRLEMHFKRALEKTINVLIFSEFDSVVQISETRNAITDFN